MLRVKYYSVSILLCDSGHSPAGVLILSARPHPYLDGVRAVAPSWHYVLTFCLITFSASTTATSHPFGLAIQSSIWIGIQFLHLDLRFIEDFVENVRSPRWRSVASDRSPVIHDYVALFRVVQGSLRLEEDVSTSRSSDDILGRLEGERDREVALRPACVCPFLLNRVLER